MTEVANSCNRFFFEINEGLHIDSLPAQLEQIVRRGLGSDATYMSIEELRKAASGVGVCGGSNLPGSTCTSLFMPYYNSDQARILEAIEVLERTLSQRGDDNKFIRSTSCE